MHTFPVSVVTVDQRGLHFGPAPTSVRAGDSDRLSKRCGTGPTCIGVAVYYIHTDHLNTPRRISDNQIVWRWDNDPFGRHTANEDPDGDSQLFTFSLRYPGQYYD
ncbi:RHS domain-containing protein, partial [Pseudidiomarina sp.]|uniref:RHS domain-containing protein n=1 Tax=Pseudidiomarina sp. TaxID=2081707 RepID=UPI003A9781FF